MVNRFLLLNLLIGMAAAVSAHAANRPFGLAGIGNLSCGQYISQSADNPEARSTYRWWIAGFLTGANVAKGRNATDVDAAEVWIGDYCRAHAFDLFAMAAYNLDKELDRRSGAHQ